MSVSLIQVLADAGYDVKNNVEDAKWLLSKVSEWDELVEHAEALEELYDEYLDCLETAEEDEDRNFPSFNEWKELK